MFYRVRVYWQIPIFSFIAYYWWKGELQNVLSKIVGLQADIDCDYICDFNRFTTFDDKEWFVATFWKIAANELPEYVNDFPEGETFFVNFLREPVDPTGDEDEEDFSTDAPKVYEELPSWVLR